MTLEFGYTLECGCSLDGGGHSLDRGYCSLNKNNHNLVTLPEKQWSLLHKGGCCLNKGGHSLDMGEQNLIALLQG